MIRVLFVCLGNICRSPMAEAVFRHKVRAAGLDDQVSVDSAGTGGYHIGSPPHKGTTTLLRAKGIDTAGMKARQIERADLDDFDYILTMDDSNLAGVRMLGSGRAVVCPLLAYAPETGYTEVPDPFYSGGYEGVYGLIEPACENLLAAIRREHNL